MPKGRNALGRVSLPTFFARAKKVGRSPQGEWKLWLLKTKQQELD